MYFSDHSQRQNGACQWGQHVSDYSERWFLGIYASNRSLLHEMLKMVHIYVDAYCIEEEELELRAPMAAFLHVEPSPAWFPLHFEAVM